MPIRLLKTSSSVFDQVVNVHAGARDHVAPRPGRGGVRFIVTGPASDGPLTLVERGVTAL